MKNARLSLKLVAIILLFVGANAIDSQPVSTQASPIVVGSVAVLADPQKYDGRRIRMIGLVSVAFESDVLYMHKEDLQYVNNKNAFWLRLTDKQRKEYEKLNFKYVIVEGTFYANGPERSEFGGAIGGITRLEYWHPLFDIPAETELPSGKQMP